jgi:uroporphyrinogen decarboxylase
LEFGEGSLETHPLSKVERLQAVLRGEQLDRPPVSLWRHFPVDDQTPEGLAAATIAFQQAFDFDFIKVTPSSSYCLRDWGITDRWQGNPEGTRQYEKRVIQTPQDWRRLPVLDPRHGVLKDQITCLNILSKHFSGKVPLVMTIFNPLSQARNLAGGDRLLEHLHLYPEELLSGLDTITRSTHDFIEVCLETGIAGIFLAVQHAQVSVLTIEEYETFGRKCDFVLLEATKDLWLNMLHLHGENIYFDQFLNYPVQILNWHDRKTPPTLTEAQQRFQGVVCGGLKQWDTLVLGTPAQVQSEAQDALDSTAGKRFILGTGCVMPITAPYGNTLAARHSVNTFRYT